MSGGVAVLLALAGLLLIIMGVKGTYADAMAVLLQGNKGSEPTAGGTHGDTTVKPTSGGKGSVK